MSTTDNFRRQLKKQFHEYYEVQIDKSPNQVYTEWLEDKLFEMTSREQDWLEQLNGLDFDLSNEMEK